MERLVLEKIKIDRISQTKRLLCYYCFFYLQQQKKSMSEMWKSYEKLLDDTENWMKHYEDFFQNQSIDDEEEIVEVYYLVTGNKNPPLQNELKNVWQKVKDIIRKERDCEKRLYDILNDKSKEHPIISKNYYCYFNRNFIGTY